MAVKLERVWQGAQALAEGLRLTFTALLRPKNTVMYPLRKVDVSPRWHGLLALPIDPQTGNDQCIICFQCERVCPSRCIHIEATGRAKERVLTRFDIEMDKCQYCGLCVESAPPRRLSSCRTTRPAPTTGPISSTILRTCTARRPRSRSRAA